MLEQFQIVGLYPGSASNTGSGNHIGNNGVITGTALSGNYFAWVTRFNIK
jgi:hypothetical protein